MGKAKRCSFFQLYHLTTLYSKPKYFCSVNVSKNEKKQMNKLFNEKGNDSFGILTELYKFTEYSIMELENNNGRQYKEFLKKNAYNIEGVLNIKITERRGTLIIRQTLRRKIRNSKELNKPPIRKELNKPPIRLKINVPNKELNKEPIRLEM